MLACFTLEHVLANADAFAKANYSRFSLRHCGLIAQFAIIGCSQQ
jgi:hypothetical protein